MKSVKPAVAVMTGFMCLMMGCASTDGAGRSRAATEAEAASETARMASEEAARAEAARLEAEEAARAEALMRQSEALGRASEVVSERWKETASQEKALLREALEKAILNGNGESARALFDALERSELTTSEENTLEVRVMIAEGRYSEARKLVRKEADRGDAAALENYWRAFDADPLYGASFVRTIKPDGNNSLGALGGGSTVSLKYKEGDTTLAAIKPDQDLRQSMYRSDIAFFRMCEILGCSFDVPQNVAVRFKQSDFNALYAASKSLKNAGYKSKFVHLIWKNENGSKYLYGTYKAWVNPFTGFPIENTGTWRTIVEPDGIGRLELPELIKRVLAQGRPSDMANYTKISGWTRSLSTKDFARQISDLLLMDFLTNNWDRFSGDANNYGANCHIHPGGLIAIDNGAAFPAWHAPRVVRRLELVKVFHRELVNRLRAITPEMINDRLFPDATKEEKKSLQRFWERRDQALRHIDAQIAKYGEDAVLAF